MTPGRGQARGFTLVELLIAITLLGLVMTLLFGGLRMGTRAWEAADSHLDRSAELQVVQGFLRRRIAKAYPLAVAGEMLSLSKHEPAAAFAGAPEELRFFTLIGPELAFGGFYRLTLRVEEMAEARRLVVDLALAGSDADELAPAEEPLLLIDSVEEVAFAYFGREEPGLDPFWRDRWKDMAGLPELVRVSVTFPEGDPRLWPELVVAPMAAGEPPRQ